MVMKTQGHLVSTMSDIHNFQAQYKCKWEEGRRKQNIAKWIPIEKKRAQNIFVQ